MIPEDGRNVHTEARPGYSINGYKSRYLRMIREENDLRIFAGYARSVCTHSNADDAHWRLIGETGSTRRFSQSVDNEYYCLAKMAKNLLRAGISGVLCRNGH